MAEHIITSTIFIGLVFLLRSVFYNRISKCLCYAMWLVVAVHLLVPVQPLPNSFQIMNIIYRAMDTGNGLRSESQEKGTEDAGYSQKALAGTSEDAVPASQQNNVEVDKNRDNDGVLLKKGNQPVSGTELEKKGTDQNNEIVTSTHLAVDFGRGKWIIWILGILKGIWILGILICGTVFLASNLCFWKKLRKDRQVLEMDSDYMRKAGYRSISVYRTKEVNTPCLFGVFHPLGQRFQFLCVNGFQVKMAV